MTSDQSAPRVARLVPAHVFVAGNSRSGTTMLARMLGRHSAVHACQELHFVEELWLPEREQPLDRDRATRLAERLLHNEREWYHTPFETGPLTAEARSVVQPLPGPVMPTDVLGAVLAAEAARAGRRVAVEQTPRNVFFLTDLLDRLPGSRGIVVVRDPRDVLLSQKNWWRRRFRGTTGVPLVTTVRQWVDYHPVTTSLIWRSGVRAGASAAARPDVSIVRFEDLVADPERVLTSLLEDLGLDFEPAVLEAPRISSSNSSDREGVGVDPTVVGRFREGLSTAELWLNQRLTASEATRYGYDPIRVRPAPLPLVGLLALWPVKTVLALLLNARRSRSLLTSIRKRLRP